MKPIEAGSTRIGFIGLGLMGRPMARNLLTAGFHVLVHTRTAVKAWPLLEAGAREAGSPAEVGAGSDVVITMLPDSADVAAVMRGESGVLAGAGPNTTWIDMSTISPAVTRELAREASERQLASLDAPVSGGPPGAAAGTLSIMVGGSKDDFDRCLPLLRHLGKKIVHVGDSGAGQVTKACNQIVVSGTLSAVAEALVFGRKAGVDPAAIREALLGGYASSRMLDVYGQRMIERDFEPGFFVRLLRKDVHIGLEMAREVAASTPVAAVVAQLLDGLVAEGEGELDAAAIVKIYERRANQELQAINATNLEVLSMERQAIQTERAPASPSYSQAVVAGNLVFVSGTVGRNMTTGVWPEGVEAQAEEALRNLEAVLAETGCGLDDVVKTTVFLTDPSDGARIAPAYSRAFPAPPPARSAPVVSGFPIPEALISIEAVAVLKH